MPFPNLVVRAQLDAAGVTRGVQQTIREFSSLRERVQRSIGTGSLLPDTEQMGRRAAEDLISGLRDTFQQRQGAIRSQLFAGLINRAEANRQGRAAAVELTRGLQAVSAELERRGLLTPAVQAQLVRQMRNAAIPAGREGAEAIAEGIEQARGEIAEAIDASITAGVRQARDQAVREAGRLMREVGDRMRSAGRRMTLFVTAPLALAGGLAVRAAAEMERLELGLRAVTGSAEETARQMAILEEVAELPGIGLREAVEGATALQLLGFSAEQATRTLRAFGNAVALTGGGPAELGRIITQLQQMASTGRVLTQDLRPIIQTAPAVGRALQEVFGTVNAQEIEALGLTFDEFLARFITGLEGLPPAATGVSEALDRMQDDIFQAQASIGRNMIPVIRELARLVEGLSESIRDLSPSTVRMGISLAAAAAVIGPLASFVGSLTTAAGVLALTLKTSLASVLLPGGVIIGGLALLTAGIVAARLEMAALREETDNYTDSLRTLPLEQTIIQLREMNARAIELREELANMEPFRQVEVDGIVTIVDTPGFAEAQRELDLLEQRIPVLVQRLGDFTAEWARSGDAAGQASQEMSTAMLRINDLLREAAVTAPFGLFDVGDLPQGLREAFRESESLLDRIDRLESAIADVREAGGGVPQGAIDLLNRLRSAVAEAQADVADRVQRLRASFDDLANLSITPQVQVRPLEIPAIVDPFSLEALQQQLEATRNRIRLDFATGLIDQSEMERQGREAGERFNDGLLTRIRTLMDSGQIREALNLAANLEVDLSGAEIDADGFDSAILAVQNISSGFRDLAGALESTSAALSGALNSIDLFIRGIQQVNSGAAIGGALGTLQQVGGALSVLAGGIALIRGFIDNPREQERNRLIEQNNRRLAEVRSALTDFRITPDTQARAGQVAGQLAADSGLIFRLLQSGQGTLPNIDRQLLERALRDTGLELVEFEQIARDAGITLFDSTGQLIIPALQQFADMMRDTIDALDGFRRTLDDRQLERDIRNRLAGAEVAAQQELSDIFGDLSVLAPKVFEKYFSGVDLTDVNAVREATLRAFDDFASGTAGFAELMGDLTRTDVLDWFALVGDTLNEFDRALRDSTTQIRNIPEVFNFTLASIRAAGVRDFTGVNAPISPQSPNFSAPITTRPPTNDPQVSGAGISITVEDGAVRITSDDDLAERVVTGVESAIRAALSGAGVRVTPDMIEAIRRGLKPSLTAAAASQGAESRRIATSWPGQ